MTSLELKIPPVVVLVLTLLFMWLTYLVTPQLNVAAPIRYFLAVIVAADAIALVVLSALAFKKANTTLHPSDPDKTSTVVDNGVYGISRNPIYLGLSLLTLAFAIVMSNVFMVLWTLLFMAYLTFFQIKPEEKILAENFGENYIAYMEKVRRWL